MDMLVGSVFTSDLYKIFSLHYRNMISDSDYVLNPISRQLDIQTYVVYLDLSREKSTPINAVAHSYLVLIVSYQSCVILTHVVTLLLCNWWLQVVLH